MEGILCSLLALLAFLAQVHSIDYPDSTNIECLSNEESAHILEYNKVEIINNLHKHRLSDLLSQRGIMPDDNPKFNQFLYCIWKKEHYLIGTNLVNFEKLERIVKNAIVDMVGGTGPAINLSGVHAMRIVNECRAIKELDVEIKIAKIQNLIVSKLQRFAKL